MSGRLTLKSHFGIVIVSGIIVSAGLYLLPKTVVTDDDAGQSVVQNQSTTTSSHPAPALSDEQLLELDSIRGANPGEVDRALAVSQYFLSIDRYDSSAVYAGRYADVANTELAWLDAGDKYYQAFSLSLNPLEKDKLAEKTREVYNKVLELNPANLHAKTNMAMTYVSSSSPMQGILMLRQVLDVNPRYVPAIMSMGALSMQSGQYDKAVLRFQDVLKIDPSNVNAKIGLAYSLIELNKKEEARQLLNEVLKENLDEVLKTEVARTLESLN